ncbi:LysM peptidoglycan-binding domain-containing protein [Gracilinema caldarium]|uniref:LysM peptidoglycan-binding domain-containing protein n=1 Tax=Gracilinema caldarium TaxID=215591 RepID=UPI0026ECE7C0|nr:LysM peptidoglycan-binding domain-containing protein [Gracilinema caldarium]
MKRIGFFFTFILLSAGVSLFAQTDLDEPSFFDPQDTSTVVENNDFTGTVDFLAEEAPITVSEQQVLSVLWNIDPSVSVEPMELTALFTLVQAAVSDTPQTMPDTANLPSGVLNNPYYRESLRYKTLAEDAFEYGDYDAAATYAAEALKNAQLSYDYINLQLTIKSAKDALVAAKSRLDWATSIGADKTYPKQYSAAQTAYGEASQALTEERWQDSLTASQRVLDALASVQQLAPLPARYTVRPWAQTKDCFWNISGYDFVYGDPTKWKLLYEKNKSKLRQPDNPNLIHPGLVLDIPSLYGEVREGMWVAGRAYAPLPKAK